MLSRRALLGKSLRLREPDEEFSEEYDTPRASLKLKVGVHSTAVDMNSSVVAW